MIPANIMQSLSWLLYRLRRYVLVVAVKPHLTLQQLLAFATDELSIRVGQTLAGLLNATLVRHSFLPQVRPVDTQ